MIYPPCYCLSVAQGFRCNVCVDQVIAQKNELVLENFQLRKELLEIQAKIPYKEK